MSPSEMRTVLQIPAMDCPAEEHLVRMALSGLPQVGHVDCDIAERLVTVLHDGPKQPLLAAVAPLGAGARVAESGPASLVDHLPAGHSERWVLWVVLLINAVMFLVELVAGLIAQSTGLLADSLDMLADATVYGIALAAVGGTLAAQSRAARISGWCQLGLAGLVLAEVVRRALTGSQPLSIAMMVVGALALAANATSVVLVAPRRRGGLHMRASWIFSVNDTLANAGLIAAGALVAATGSALPDLAIGTVIATIVASGGWRTLRMARGAPAAPG